MENQGMMHSLECPYFELFIKLMKLQGIPIKWNWDMWVYVGPDHLLTYFFLLKLLKVYLDWKWGIWNQTDFKQGPIFGNNVQYLAK